MKFKIKSGHVQEIPKIKSLKISVVKKNSLLRKKIKVRKEKTAQVHVIIARAIEGLNFSKFIRVNV